MLTLHRGGPFPEPDVQEARAALLAALPDGIRGQCAVIAHSGHRGDRARVLYLGEAAEAGDRLTTLAVVHGYLWLVSSTGEPLAYRRG